MSKDAVLADLRGQIGQEESPGEWMMVDQGRIDRFADATEDHQWIHVDAGRAKEESPYGDTIAHGFLTPSLLPALTGAVIFSLGIVTGMGLRDPTAVVSLPLESTAPPPAATPPAEETLAFNQGLQAPNNSIEGLRINQQEASKTTQELLARVERELKLEEVAETPKLRPPARPEPNARERAVGQTTMKPLSQPAAGLERAAVTAEGQYTVQVFSSRNRANARNLMLRLRKEGFAAYLNQGSTAPS